MPESIRHHALAASRFATSTLVDAAHPQRSEVEHYIAQVYLQRYGAVLRSFLPQLLVYRDAGGAIRAAIGTTAGCSSSNTSS